MVHAMATQTSQDAELLLDGARYGDVEDVQSALEQRVSADTADDSGRTGKACCCSQLRSSSTRHALRRLGSHYGMVRSDVRLHVYAALHMASANGHADVVSILIAAGAVILLLRPQMPDLAALTFPPPPTLRPNDPHAPSSCCVCRICARATRRETLRCIGRVSMAISRRAVIDRRLYAHAHASQSELRRRIETSWR